MILTASNIVEESTIGNNHYSNKTKHVSTNEGNQILPSQQLPNALNDVPGILEEFIAVNDHNTPGSSPRTKLPTSQIIIVLIG